MGSSRVRGEEKEEKKDGPCGQGLSWHEVPGVEVFFLGCLLGQGDKGGRRRTDEVLPRPRIRAGERGVEEARR